MNRPFLVFNNKGETSPKVLIQIFALVLFVVLIIFIIGKKTADNKNNDTQNKNLSSSVAQNNAFLSEVPLNEKSRIYKSGKKTLNTGELVEELIVFNSKKTVSENQKFYEEWARANNWKTDGDVSKEKDVFSLFFLKKGKGLQISLEQEKNNTAKITMVYTKL